MSYKEGVSSSKRTLTIAFGVVVAVLVAALYLTGMLDPLIHPKPPKPAPVTVVDPTPTPSPSASPSPTPSATPTGKHVKHAK